MSGEVDSHTAYETLGEMVLEEVLVQAGVKQGREISPSDRLSVSLTYSVSTDRDRGCLLVHCDRLGKPPLEINLNMMFGSSFGSESREGK